mmetsp:Transcript_15939/g.28829  ORF Transcript_15939/g.28829 Transcript_15939/m.28829 type:complete len:115 (+) Transcript_15939:67-411(+)
MVSDAEGGAEEITVGFTGGIIEGDSEADSEGDNEEDTEGDTEGNAVGFLAGLKLGLKLKIGSASSVGNVEGRDVGFLLIGMSLNGIVGLREGGAVGVFKFRSSAGIEDIGGLDN